MTNLEWPRTLATPPNLVSLARLLMAPVILWVFEVRGRSAAVALFGVAMLTDWLDGYLARRLNMVTDAGRVLDPLADKVVVDAVAVVLAVRGEIPVWAAVLLVVRDVGIVAGAVALAGKGGAMPASNAIGKVAFTAIGLMVLVHLADWRVVEPVALWTGVAAAVISTVSYARIGIAHSRKDSP